MRTSFDVFDAFVCHKANEKIRRGNTYGEGLVFRGQRRLPPQRCPNFLVLCIMFYTFRRGTAKFGVVTHMGSGVF